MKRLIILFLVLLCLCEAAVFLTDAQPQIVEGTQHTATAQVTDRAISDNMPYLGVVLEDGTGLCLWDPGENVIPDDIAIGDRVKITYGKQDGFDRYVVISVVK